MNRYQRLFEMSWLQANCNQPFSQMAILPRRMLLLLLLLLLLMVVVVVLVVVLVAEVLVGRRAQTVIGL